MNCKKSLSAILSFVMVVTMVASVIVMPAAAATENGNVPFGSPAITANVGETIDLSKYGVEFTEGVSTKDSLTWWKNTASTVVPFKQPAILANVGDTVDLTKWGVEFANGVATNAANISWQKKLPPNTVTFGTPAILTDAGTKLNFADYPVELTKGNVVAGDKLTWTQATEVTVPLITFTSPAIPANVGDVIDLTAYAVEFENDKVTNPADITWKNGDAAVTSFTPAAKGVTALTATANGVSKSIYVVAKEASETKYVLYRNDFNSAADVAQLHESTMGSTVTTATYADGGYLSHLRNGAATATNQSMLFAPDWLCDFGAYRLEASVSVSAYGNTGRYFSFLTHGSNTAKSGPYYVAGHTKAGKWFFQKNKSATSWGLTAFTGGDKTGAFTMNTDTYYTYALEYNNSTVTSYFDGTKIMQFAVPDADPIVTGRPGIGFHGIDASADYFEVALAADSLETTTIVKSFETFTPATKGVTAFNVTDGETTKTVYVVAKNAEDTEYVLYENNFDSAADLDDLQYIAGNTAANYPMAVANGEMTITRVNSANGNTVVAFPMWLADFGDYSVEASIATTAQYNNSRYYGIVYRGNPTGDYTPQYASLYFRNGKWQGQRRVLTAAGSDWNAAWDNWGGPSVTNAFTAAALGTYATHKVEVQGDSATAYFNGNQVGTYAPDNVRDTGFVGLFFTAVDAKVDYFKVTLTEPVKTTAVTEFTPAAAGVTELIATANGVSKAVYVVAKEAAETEYVLYENDFNTAASFNDVTVLTGGAAADKYTVGCTNGNLYFTRASGVTSVQTTLAFPMWLADFGDYTIETSIAVAAQTNNTRYYGLVFRGNPNLSKPVPYYASLYNRSGKWQGQRRINTTNSDWNKQWDNWAGPSVDGAFTPVALGTFATHKVEVKDDTAIAYYNGTQVGTYTPVDVKDTGFVGLFFHSLDAKVDYFKVTLSAQETEPEQITAFTPDKAGVTALTVKDANGNEKNVYVVAKDAEDTEYVLFENDFNNAADVNALTVAEGGATLTVDGGKLIINSNGSYIRLPEYVGDFGDYKMEMVASTTAYGSNSDWLGFMVRGQHADSGKEAYVPRVRHSSGSWDAAGYYYRNASGTMERYRWGGHTTIAQGSTHTYTLMAQGDLLSMKQDANYVFYNTERKEHRVGHLGIALSAVTLAVDSIRVTLADVALPDAPLSATFTAEAGLPYGTIAGNLTVNLAADGDAAVDVVYYWGDGEGKLANYGAFDKVLVKGNTTVTDLIPKGTVVPAGATELRVYTANEAGESDNCVVVPLPLSVRNMTLGEEKLSFQVVSDTHIMPEDGFLHSVYNAAHLADLLQDIAKFDPDSAGLFQGGDIVDNGKATEYQHLNKIWDTYGNGLPLEGVLGNHEYWNTKTQEGTVTNYATYTGAPITPEKPYYSKNVNGYDFFFLNTSIIDPSGGNHNVSTLGEAQLAWLDEGLSKVDAQTPAFIFHHQKFNQIADADALQAVLKKYPNAIFLTSHTHNDMNTEGIFEYANDAMCNTANTSSVSYTVYTHYNPNGENIIENSQAYYVEVYDDRVLFRGMDVMTDQWIPSAQFVFWYGDVDTYPTDANLFPAASGEYETFSFDPSALTAVGDDGFTAEDTATVAELEGKFNFYYDREGAHYRERDLFDNLDDNDIYNPSGAATGWSKWVPSGAWLTRTTGKTSGEMFRKIDSLVPLNSKGEEVLVENFETTFDVKFVNYNGGVILGFRQQEAGHFTNGYYNLVKTMGFVSVNKGGMSIASGNDILNKSGGNATNDMYNHFETDFATDLPETVTVKVRVIGDDITVEIYDYATKELLHAEADTLSLGGAGKIAYGVSAVGHSIGNIELTKLNGFGAPLDIAADRDYADGDITLVDMQETDAGYQYTVEITPDAGYELEAGSLYAMDADGNYYVPTRVGFRQGGDASRYTITIQGQGALFAAFKQPTKEDPNIGNLGTSINTELAGLRFVSRFTHMVENGVEYVVLGGEKLAVADYGVLMGIDTVVGDNELNLALAESNKYVQNVSVKTKGVYYDYCDDQVDMSICITGIDKVKGGADMDILSRTYVVLENGDVLYGDTWSSSYNETLGVYKTATLAEVKTAGAAVYHGRATAVGTALQLPKYGGTGFTMQGTFGGDMWVDLYHEEYASALNVVIDGDAENVKTYWVEAGENNVKVINDLPYGDHSIQITRSNSNYGIMTINSVTYNGTLGTATVNPLQFEFLGDSITAAGGESGNPEGGSADNLAKSKAHNTFFGYAAQTARAFGADVSLVARSGYTTAQVRKLFNDSGWDFANNQKDVVVINLGTNDFGYAGKPDPNDIDGYADTCNALLADVRAKYADAYIIWGYGMMFDKGVDQLKAIVEAYAETNNDNKILFCNFSSVKNNAGTSNHPDQQGHDDAAALLTAFIRENCTEITK